MYKIEDVTEATKLVRSKGGRKQKYPFLEMKVGQTFFVPCPTKRPDGIRASIVTSAGRLLGRGHIATQVRTENGVDGVRVWRVK